MRVYAPEFINAQTMYSVLGQVFDEEGVLRSNRYVFDFELCKGIDAAGLIMLDTVFLRLTIQKCFIQVVPGSKLPKALRVQVKWQSDSVSSILSKEEFISQHDKSKPGHSLRLHRVKVADAKLWIQKVFNNWLAHKLYASSLIVAPQTQSFMGLLENVKTHAGVEVASIVSDYDANREAIRFILSDAGRGIPTTIRRDWDEAISDEVAIAKAIEKGSLRKTLNRETSHTEGGLGRLVKEIVDQQVGNIIVTSGFGRLSCLSGPGGKIHKFEPAHAYYPGTMIEVNFSTSSIRKTSTLNEPSAEATFLLKYV